MIEELLNKRKQINIFRDDIYPEKELIENLLEKTHKLVPSKQNLMPYQVLVLGPDQAEAKTKLYKLASNIHDSDSYVTNTPYNLQLLAPYVLLFTQRLALPANQITMEKLKNRDTFSRYLYDLHELINNMLNKKSGLSYEEIRERYEHFRSRCNKKKLKNM